MTLTHKYCHGGDWCGISFCIPVINLQSYKFSINKLQRFICDKKQNSGIEISYNDECVIQNCNENNMSPSVLC